VAIVALVRPDVLAELNRLNRTHQLEAWPAFHARPDAAGVCLPAHHAGLIEPQRSISGQPPARTVR
jgi:hypothetical protein